MAKSIKVEDFKNRVNGILANDDIADDTRMAFASLLEDILIETGNYRGYKYVDWENGGNDEYFHFMEVNPGAHISVSKFVGKSCKRLYL